MLAIDWDVASIVASTITFALGTALAVVLYRLSARGAYLRFHIFDEVESRAGSGVYRSRDIHEIQGRRAVRTTIALWNAGRCAFRKTDNSQDSDPLGVVLTGTDEITKVELDDYALRLDLADNLELVSQTHATYRFRLEPHHLNSGEGCGLRITHTGPFGAVLVVGAVVDGSKLEWTRPQRWALNGATAMTMATILLLFLAARNLPGPLSRLFDVLLFFDDLVILLIFGTVGLRTRALFEKWIRASHKRYPVGVATSWTRWI